MALMRGADAAEWVTHRKLEASEIEEAYDRWRMLAVSFTGPRSVPALTSGGNAPERRRTQPA